MSIHQMMCGRCGYPVTKEVDSDGRLVEECLCLIRYDGEEMPSVWLAEDERQSM